ncbi:MAG: formylmethanofuran dehydrogenase subunit C [Mariniblastus sp.]
MALLLTQQVETTIPIEVKGITPDRLAGRSENEIGKTMIWHGRRQVELGSVFSISGSISDDETIVWAGNLTPVHQIGAAMHTGVVRISSEAGRHVGSQMTGGTIIAESDVSDFLGVEMSGGMIRVQGSAGDLVGGNYPGSKSGMNRGSILIEGNAGKGVGQSMRRGTIVVKGDSGKLSGWNMRAGTILVLGKCGANVGAGMTRGTIVVGNDEQTKLLPTFLKGAAQPVPVLQMISNWLVKQQFDFDTDVLKSSFQTYYGDQLRGGRGEIMVRA